MGRGRLSPMSKLVKVKKTVPFIFKFMSDFVINPFAARRNSCVHFGLSNFHWVIVKISNSDNVGVKIGDWPRKRARLVFVWRQNQCKFSRSSIFRFSNFYFLVSGGLIVARAVLWKNERVNGERWLAEPILTHVSRSSKYDTSLAHIQNWHFWTLRDFYK